MTDVSLSLFVARCSGPAAVTDVSRPAPGLGPCKAVCPDSPSSLRLYPCFSACHPPVTGLGCPLQVCRFTGASSGTLGLEQHCTKNQPQPKPVSGLSSHLAGARLPPTAARRHRQAPRHRKPLRGRGLSAETSPQGLPTGAPQALPPVSASCL